MQLRERTATRRNGPGLAQQQTMVSLGSRAEQTVEQVAVSPVRDLITQNEIDQLTPRCGNVARQNLQLASRVFVDDLPLLDVEQLIEPRIAVAKRLNGLPDECSLVFVRRTDDATNRST